MMVELGKNGSWRECGEGKFRKGSLLKKVVDLHMERGGVVDSSTN